MISGEGGSVALTRDELMRVTLHTDGGVRTGGVNGPTGGKTGPMSIGYVIHDARGKVLVEQSKLIGEGTVNEAEYSALIAGLYNCRYLGATEVEVFSDSKLIVHQMKGEWACNQAHLRDYRDEARYEAGLLQEVTYTWVRRSQNQHADKLTRKAFDED